MTSQRLRMRVVRRIARQLGKLQPGGETFLERQGLVVGDRLQRAHAWPANCFAILRRRLFFSIELFFAINVSCVPRLAGSALTAEREVECLQAARALRRRSAPSCRSMMSMPQTLVDLVVVDLREHDVLLQADGE